MKYFIKSVPYVIVVFGITNIITGFWTKNYWQGIAGVWMIIAAPVFKPENFVCPSANCCQVKMEDNSNG